MRANGHLEVNSHRFVAHLIRIAVILLACFASAMVVQAQGETFGAFRGQARDRKGGGVDQVRFDIKNKETGLARTKYTHPDGDFYDNNYPPGDYEVMVSKPGYITQFLAARIPITLTTIVIPLPAILEVEAPVAQASPTPVSSPQPVASPFPQPTTPAQPVNANKAEINSSDARRGGSFSEADVQTLPLGGTTLTRSFDELALLLPGVAPPPETGSTISGPGVGPGVGSAGQFAVNGIRSRANNFTVDGSDNNDEDIGVRRQGFLALVPQSIESIKEFQITTLLAPAQYGRNIGAQVNAVSKSGGNQTHGTVYALFNSSQLNAREFFDTTNGNAFSPLMTGSQPVLLDGKSKTVQNQSGGEDSSTLGQGGFVMGGPIVPADTAKPGRSIFYFFSAEGQILNAVKEQSFAVPTVAQRGFSGTGATGLTRTPFADINGVVAAGSAARISPTSLAGDALFSYFPFPNNPTGVYGANTYTTVLPASGQGKILSGKVDSNFKLNGKQQSFTARYNFTQDWREIPSTGGAIFSTIRPRIRTQNLSTFLNSDLTDSVFNYLRLSYGRTRLNFEDVPDATGFLLPSSFGNPSDAEGQAVSQTLSGLLKTTISTAFTNPADSRFLLRAPVIANVTAPPGGATPNTGPVLYQANRFLGTNQTTENLLASFGSVGEVIIAGFSPVGVDVFNFPQRRVNNTYQLADTLMAHKGSHNFAFGADLRRTELNSELARNARPLITVQGAPQATGNPTKNPQTGQVTFTNVRLGSGFISAVDLAAAGAISGFFQTLSTTGSPNIGLRFYQLNFFGQDEWRWRPNFSLSYGLRYEYNTPPTEMHRRIENTFTDPLLSLVPGMTTFINGRTQIFDPDRNNFAPRISFAYVPRPNTERTTVIRAGYGLFYDQILGAVVSQSRNVFPNFLTANFAGAGDWANPQDVLNPGFSPRYNLNHLSTPFCPCIFRNPSVLAAVGFLAGQTAQTAVPSIEATTNRGASTFGATLPSRALQMPMAHQFSVTVDRELAKDMVISAAYVGTVGRKLLRFTTPNLGPNELILPLGIDAKSSVPDIWGVRLSPGVRVGAGGIPSTLGDARPTANVGVINLFETTARSRYDALQVQLRGRVKSRTTAQYQISYTLSRSNDDASDVFELAGSPALPQNSMTLAGEYAPSNFDSRHRVAYDYIIDFPQPSGPTARALLGNIQLVGTGQFQTGRPFTVNSIYDVNLDGNLTDRLNTTTGIVATGDRSQPYRLTVDPATLLAPVGQDGQVPRNSLRATSLFVNNLAIIKTFNFKETYRLVFRTEIFNVFNRANFGIPVRFLESPGFGNSTYTVTPGRRLQFALKLSF